MNDHQASFGQLVETITVALDEARAHGLTPEHIREYAEGLNIPNEKVNDVMTAVCDGIASVLETYEDGL